MTNSRNAGVPYRKNDVGNVEEEEEEEEEAEEEEEEVEVEEEEEEEEEGGGEEDEVEVEEGEDEEVEVEEEGEEEEDEEVEVEEEEDKEEVEGEEEEVEVDEEEEDEEEVEEEEVEVEEEEDEEEEEVKVEEVEEEEVEVEEEEDEEEVEEEEVEVEEGEEEEIEVEEEEEEEVEVDEGEEDAGGQEEAAETIELEDDPNKEERYEIEPNEEKQEQYEEDPEEEEFFEEDPNEEEEPQELFEKLVLEEDPNEDTDEKDPVVVAHLNRRNDDNKEHRSNTTPSNSGAVKGILSVQNQEQTARLLSTDTQAISMDPKSDGSSIKRKRRSRWDKEPIVEEKATDEPIVEEKATDGDDVSSLKKRKTRWVSDDNQLKVPVSPILPKLKKGKLAETSEVSNLVAQISEINRKLAAPKIHDDRPENERSPSPPPICNEFGIRVNTREARLRNRLIEQRCRLMLDLVQKNHASNPAPDHKPLKFIRRLYIPEKEFPGYNFIGLILGPCGMTQKQMEKETGARISLRGRGSQKKEKPKTYNDGSDNDDLHVYIEAASKDSVDAAVAMVEKLLVPLEEHKNELKQAQLRAFAKLQGTFREGNTTNVEKTTPKTNVACCEVCGDTSHRTVSCPLTVSTRGTGSAVQKVDSFSNIGNKPTTSTEVMVPTPTFPAPIPWVANPTAAPTPAPAPRMYTTVPVSVPMGVRQIDEANLYIANLPQTVDDYKLVEMFSPFGEIQQSKIVKDHTTGLNKGYGFVKYVSPVFAAEAIARMNGMMMEGRPILVQVAAAPAPAPRSSYATNLNTGIPQGVAYLPSNSCPVVAQVNPYPRAVQSVVPQNHTFVPVYPSTYPRPVAIAQGQISWQGPLGTMVPNSYNASSQSGGSNSLSDQSPASFGYPSQTPVSNSQMPRGLTPSLEELSHFPGYLNSLDSSTPDPTSGNSSSFFGPSSVSRSSVWQP